MSIVGSYLRLSPAEFARALEEPGRAREFKQEQAALEHRRGPSELRFHDTEKAWAGLAHLLARRGLPTCVIDGEDELPGDEDWGYGPPRLLAPDRLAAALGELGELPFDALADGVTPAELAAAEVYPARMWDDPFALEYLAAHWTDLRRYLDRAARYRHGLLIWYS
ncbi:YfbM family protein [Kitasatospora sp. NPDC088134]|uniref:YfbM family protein n=1 Tax=Kitasatospora sp. NPDC088134 TaxID=3364071 RepID=UPI0038077F3A